MTPKEFYKELEKHDWHYQMSDDRRWWSAGNANYKRLSNIAISDAALLPLFNAYRGYVFEGKAKPEEPK